MFRWSDLCDCMFTDALGPLAAQVKRSQSQGSDRGENGEEPASPSDPNVHPPLNQGVVWGPLVSVGG
jgi:hypothetical protein